MRVAEIDNFTLLLMVLVGSLLLCIVATLIFRSTVPKLVAHLFRTDDAERLYLERLKDAYLVRDRVRTLQNELSQLQNIQNRMESDQRKLRRQISLAAAPVPELIHEAGDARPGQSKYVARLSVDSMSPLLKPSSDVYNPMWRHVNLVEVWAGSREEARQILDQAYSDKLGYVKMFIDFRPGPNEGTAR